MLQKVFDDKLLFGSVLSYSLLLQNRLVKAILYITRIVEFLCMSFCGLLGEPWSLKFGVAASTSRCFGLSINQSIMAIFTCTSFRLSNLFTYSPGHLLSASVSSHIIGPHFSFTNDLSNAPFQSFGPIYLPQPF